ncbi:putative XPA protein C-terminus [Lyophyllum shimeji]|uniref:DNA repair protein RAD14 n=1 Tax=Lyophyllum shimeji TaxID=47721 RepID=A0A9P3UKI0_LYOSH|nr:putative XPA protein C-terminus [Lyophyllum shimeji]
MANITSTPATPPPRDPSLSSFQLTPEQVKHIELNRLKAKAKQREKEQEASTSSLANANNKRPIGVTPAVSNSPTAPSASKPLKRDSRLGTYFEYDLSKMVNSKGGFLLEDGNEIDEEVQRKEKERERQRARQNLDPPMHLDPALNPKCRECNSMDIDQTFRRVFRCLICKKCENQYPEKYSLLTKTECKEDYLLTDPELRDEELLPHLLKANPHASTYANMMLYVRYQVEEFAWKKWGSPEALDAEYERRVAEKKKKKNKKFEQGLRDLRKRTKESVWQRRRDEEHKHVFSAPEAGPDGTGQQYNIPSGNTTTFAGDLYHHPPVKQTIHITGAADLTTT